MIRTSVSLTLVVAVCLAAALVVLGPKPASADRDGDRILAGIAAGVLIYGLLDNDNGCYRPSRPYYAPPPPPPRRYYSSPGYGCYPYQPPVYTYRPPAYTYRPTPPRYSHSYGRDDRHGRPAGYSHGPRYGSGPGYHGGGSGGRDDRRPGPGYGRR